MQTVRSITQLCLTHQRTLQGNAWCTSGIPNYLFTISQPFQLMKKVSFLLLFCLIIIASCGSEKRRYRIKSTCDPIIVIKTMEVGYMKGDTIPMNNENEVKRNNLKLCHYGVIDSVLRAGD